MKNSISLVIILMFTNLMFSQTQSLVSTSFDMPIGSVVAWAGNRAMLPEGWLVCDGSQISKDNFPKLCALLGNSWGPTDAEMSVARLFYLPDLRGVFLRGVNEGRNDEYSDPDSENRTYKSKQKPSNFQSNQVGSYQLDTIAKHNHAYTKPKGTAPQSGSTTQCYYTSEIDFTSNTGGKETRPNNAYVYWIIKAK